MDAEVDTAPMTKSERIGLGGLIREVAAGGLAAATAGVVAGGLGGRLAMRLSALVNPEVAGVRTDNGNRIGEITADGTLGLVIFGGLLAGAVAGVMWVTLRPWLPAGGRQRYSAAAIAAVGLVGFTVVDARNRDFFLLDPQGLHIVMFLALIGAAGALTAWLDGRLTNRWSNSRPFTAAAVLLVAFGGFLAMPAVAGFFSSDFCFCETPPRPAGGFFVAAMGATVVAWAARLRGRDLSARLQIFGTAVTVGAVTAGLIHLAGQVLAIV